MLIFNSWYTGGRSNIYAADDDGSNLGCLTVDINLQRYQRLRISPDHGRLLFLVSLLLKIRDVSSSASSIPAN